MTSFVQKLFSCGSKNRSSSARHGNMKKTVPAPHVCESCQEQFSTRAGLNSHSKNCKKVASFAEQNKSMDRSRDTKPHGASEATLTPVNVQIQSNTSTKKDLAEKNEHHDRSTLDPNRTITNDKSFTSVSTDKPYRRTDTFSDKPGSALMSPIDNEVNKITSELLKKAPKARRDAELNFITKNIEKKTHTRYLISEQWIEDYTAYLNGEHSQSPQPINNDKLKEMVISKTLPNNIYLVNEIIWKFVHKLYGGGPEIKQFNKSISFAGANTSTDHLSETQTADTFSRSDGTESLRNSILDTYTAPWYTNTTPYLKPMGFHNTSFYCYMNASLQMLLSITDFSQYIYQEKYKTLSGKEETKFWKAMTEVVHSHFKQQSCVLPRALRRLSVKNFDPDQQHDAHEFLSFLLSGLQDEVNLPCPKKETEFKNPDSAWSYYRKSNISLVDDLLAGQLVSTVRCTSCKHVSTTYDPFLDLSLPIIPGKTKNLDDCLQAYQQEEDIDDSYKCEKCKATGKAKKRLHIHRCPRYLLLNLKRFETYPKKRKIKDMITYAASNFRIKDESEGQLASYTLVGIVVHYGPIDSGHYTCFTKRGDDWIHCDDDNLSKVDENEVLSKEAYVFLYERKPTIGVAKL